MGIVQSAFFYEYKVVGTLKKGIKRSYKFCSTTIYGSHGCVANDIINKNVQKEKMKCV